MKRPHVVTPVAPGPTAVPVFTTAQLEGFWRQEHLLPDQFFTPAHESYRVWTGERLLMLAVLQEAVHTYLRYCSSATRRGRRLFAETRTWFLSRERHYLYTFENVCEYLGLDPGYIRRGLAKWPRTEERRPKPLRAARRRTAPISKPHFAQAA
jgi:hypothetical protein